ncbi:hypothetical protein [Metabacillus dongyingensis]|uniref:hypothetical protein n=1 Tax=Metabacillus dongyingensis TaxID=2874282 RepID=UPI001CBDAE66|nr:hypothetical protein [Metabacillus dongyingensis]UAL53508.1 hypothetical protein K8L98_06905 [Metabacillus dongyingensis]
MPIKLPWKKNLMKVPKEVEKKISELRKDTQFVFVASAKEVKKKDIIDGVYAHLEMEYNKEHDKVVFPTNIVPNSEVGRYSFYNRYGRSVKLKKLPKIDKTYSNEVPIFGDWSRGSNTVSWTRQVFQQEHWIPQELGIEISLLKENEETYSFKFLIDRPLNTNSTHFNSDLLYYCNILQENTGVCSIFEPEASESDYIDTIFVEWELLPPGEDNKEKNINSFVKNHRNPNQKLRDLYADRIEFFESLKPKNYIKGSNQFSSYFGALLTDECVILENANYGNAVYIFFEDWKELSKLSRTELLSNWDKEFERITHRGNWKNKINNVLWNKMSG